MLFDAYNVFHCLSLFSWDLHYVFLFGFLIFLFLQFSIVLYFDSDSFLDIYQWIFKKRIPFKFLCDVRNKNLLLISKLT